MYDPFERSLDGISAEFSMRRGNKVEFNRLLKRLGFALRLRMFAQATGRASERHDEIVEKCRAEYHAAKAAVDEATAAIDVEAMFNAVISGGFDKDVMDLLVNQSGKRY